jgi:hypothetical protein
MAATIVWKVGWSIAVRRFFAMSTIPESEQRAAEVAWEVAKLFPPQGEWSPDEYLSLGGKKGAGAILFGTRIAAS